MTIPHPETPISYPAVGGPFCGELVARPFRRLWYAFDPDLAGQDRHRLPTLEGGALRIVGDDDALADFMHATLVRHQWMAPMGIVRGCYYRVPGTEVPPRFLEIRPEGGSDDQARYRRLSYFLLHYASHIRYPERRLRRFNAELAIAIGRDWPLDRTVQDRVTEYIAGHIR